MTGKAYWSKINITPDHKHIHTQNLSKQKERKGGEKRKRQEKQTIIYAFDKIVINAKH